MAPAAWNSPKLGTSPENHCELLEQAGYTFDPTIDGVDTARGASDCAYRPHDYLLAGQATGDVGVQRAWIRAGATETR